MVRRIVIGLIVPSVLVLSGCDNKSTGPGEASPGMFTARITGDANRQVSGPAVFGSLDILGEAGFGIALQDDAGTVVITVGKASMGRPAPGTYTLGDSDAPMYAEVNIGAGLQSQFYVSRSGQLTITASTAQALQGTVTFEARTDFGPGAVEVTANFHAFCLAGGTVSCD